MVQVSFYTGIAKRLPYLCRLLRKAEAQGARVGVCGPATLLDRLDRELWIFAPTEFLPHLRMRRDRALAARQLATPILLSEQAVALPHREMLLNLGSELPEGFAEFQRVLEVVSTDAEQVQLGRLRYRQYEAAGANLAHHVVSE